MNDDNFEKLRSISGRNKEVGEAAKKETAKKNLLNAIRKKFTTSLFGNISRFEQNFGRLWGFQKGRNEILSESEKRGREIWMKCRKSVLDFSNNLLRELEKELDNYCFEYLGYHFDFKVKE